MQNYSNDNTAGRYKAHVDSFGITQHHLRNPYIVAWWSAAFPGFGHMLLSKEIRGLILVVLEIFININANINLGIIYMFQGDMSSVISVVDTRWLIIYMPVYLFTIWDSYRTTIDLNNISVLEEHEQHRYNTFSLGSFKVHTLDKQNPAMALLWSLFMPGLGHLYIGRLISAYFIIFWVLIFFYFSNVLEALVFLILGDIQFATSILEPKWLLFLPSTYGFAMFDAYTNAVENNKLFDREQKHFLKKKYQHTDFRVLKGQKVR